MTVPEILKELEPYTGRFPKKAMLAAVHAYSGANRTPIPIHFGH
jgi:hypothetical protein